MLPPVFLGVGTVAVFVCLALYSGLCSVWLVVRKAFSVVLWCYVGRCGRVSHVRAGVEVVGCGWPPIGLVLLLCCAVKGLCCYDARVRCRVIVSVVVGFFAVFSG